MASPCSSTAPFRHDAVPTGKREGRIVGVSDNFGTKGWTSV